MAKEKLIPIFKGQLIEDDHGHSYEVLEVTRFVVVLRDGYGERCYVNFGELQKELRAGWLRFRPEPGCGGSPAAV